MAVLLRNFAALVALLFVWPTGAALALSVFLSLEEMVEKCGVNYDCKNIHKLGIDFHICEK